MAAHLILTERDLDLPINIFVDNQAAIKSGEVFTAKSGHYLIDRFLNMIRTARRKHQCRREDITIRWVASHKDVPSNEKADQEAKHAASDTSHTSSRKRLPHFLRKDKLPLSISALLQNQKHIESERWKRTWATSARYPHLSRIDDKLLTGSFVQLGASLTCRQSSLLMWLRMKHSPLHNHLFHIKRHTSPFCASCPNKVETVKHYLIECPQYAHERALLEQNIRHATYNIPLLLSDHTAIPALLKFVHATKRFQASLGDVSICARKLD